MIRCDECELAEMPRWKRVLTKLDRIIFGQPPFLLFDTHARAVSSAFSVAMGKPAKTMQERHAEEYVKTGDRRELQRSLRHVKEEK